MSTNVASREKVDHVMQFLQRRLGHMQNYHGHGETIARAILPVTLAIAGFVLIADYLPASWVQPIYTLGEPATFLALAGSWLFIHAYMRWRLRTRRFAAQYDACLLNVLRRWATDVPSLAEITPAAEGISRPSPIVRVIDFFFPLERATVVREEGLKGYPAAVVEEFAGTTTRVIRAERVASLASLFLFIWAVAHVT